MEPLVYLAGLKQGGWLTKTGQYSTDINSAMQVGLSEALTLCRRHKEAHNILVPIDVNWINAI